MDIVALGIALDNDIEGVTVSRVYRDELDILGLFAVNFILQGHVALGLKTE